MTSVPLYRAAMLTGVGIIALLSAPASAQEPEPAAEPENEEGSVTGSIVVEGQRLRGQLDVEQAPLLELGEADIAAEGVASIADLITQITNQTGSSRGRGGAGRPIVLINGIRVGSFREFSNYPPEALDRVEVFPEEVALRFGFPPDRRVINLILKENYRNAEVELEFEGPSRGGYHQREQELGFLQIVDDARLNFNLEASDTSFLTEDEREISQTDGSVSDVPGDPDQAPFRSLTADSRDLQANVSWAKSLIGSGVSISANANYVRNDRRSLQGLNTVLLTDAAGNSAFRTFGADTPLEQVTSTDTISTSGSLTKPINAFRLTSTFNASLAETTQRFDQRFDTEALQDSALAGTLAIDGALPTSVDTGFETAFTRSTSANSLTTLRGPITNLPGGELLATFDLGANWQQIESQDTRTSSDTSLSRTVINTGANVVVPITSRRNGFADALGSFTLNLNAGIDRVSDFGTLGDYNVGLTWAPFSKLNLSATYIQREVAPSLSVLGAPQVETLNVPVFDFVNGETVLATFITGGNPDQPAETQRDWKFAANWQLPFWDNARFTVEYIRNRSSDVTRTLPPITAETEAAFPDRITRDATGRLTRIDNRWVTFEETRAERLNFSLFFRGSIGAGQRGEGASGGGRPTGATPARPAGQVASGASSGPSGGVPSGSSDPAREGRRAAFMQLREQICADDGLDVLMRLAEAAKNGEDLSETMPGFNSRRVQGMLSRVLDEDGNVDPERVAQVRSRICSMDPAAMGGRPGGPDDPAQGGPRAAGFAAFRAVACAEDGEAKLRALIARIEAGEDVSDELPGFDPNMAGFIIDRLRGNDGTISSERIAEMRGRFCRSEGEASGQGGQQARGGPMAGFNPLARRSFRGFRYFVSLNHAIELENEILIAPGLDPLDQLGGQGTSAFGLPRHTSRLEAGIFGGGVGVRASARYTGSTRLVGSGPAGSGDIIFGDLATFDLRVFAEVGQLLGNNEGAPKNLRVSLRASNIFDAQRRITDQNGDTPVNFQPFVVDPVGRFIGVDIRKLF